MSRLLVIEDDSEISSLLERYLKRLGYEVVLAADGEVGIKHFRDAPFDLVITDGLLPKKTGYDVVQAIRAHERGKSVGVIMMSAAFRGHQARREATVTGADAFFAKPFVLTELRDSLAELLKKYGRPQPVKPSVVSPPPVAAARPVTTAAPSAHAPPPPQPIASPAPRAAAHAPQEAPRLSALERVASPEGVARMLLRAARQGFSGVVRFVDEQNQLQVAFIQGVIVGANDNLREHLLGERLWKAGRLTTEQMRQLNQRMADRGERVAEALLALGFCEAGEALQYVDEQTVVRARRALSWNGAVQIKEGEDDAHALATTTLDVADVILGWGLDRAQEPVANQLVAARATHRIARHPHFDELLMALARVAPTAKLPGVLLAGQANTVVDAAKNASAPELYAAWLAGLIVLEGDPEPDARHLPDVLRVAKGEGAVDKHAVEEVCAALLRARGRNYYELVDEQRTAPAGMLRAKLKTITDRVGPAVLEGRALGPAASAARELWHVLDEAEAVFSDDALRAAYDTTLKPLSPPPRRASGPEDAFLEGQQALADGAILRALGCFELAVASRPADPDYVSYLGWSQVLSGDRKHGIACLMSALRAHPQAMRPVFFLGMVAAQDGDAARARALLEECARRSPDDAEVMVTLSALSPS
jgi:CheY-like chemotaxis protein